jgi:hypothetical protein
MRQKGESRKWKANQNRKGGRDRRKSLDLKLALFWFLPPQHPFLNQQKEKKPCREVISYLEARAFLNTLTRVGDPYVNWKSVLEYTACVSHYSIRSWKDAKHNPERIIYKHHCPYVSHQTKHGNSYAEHCLASGANPSIGCARISVKINGCQVKDDESN